MNEQKRRKNPPDVDLDEPEYFTLIEPEPVELAFGYSISVKYDKDGRPLIYVKKYGDVDTKGLRREIERNYPGAAIHGLEKPRLIEIEDAHKETSNLRINKRKKRRKRV